MTTPLVTIRRRLRADLPWTTVALRLPQDVLDAVRSIAPTQGFASPEALLRAYVGRGLREAEARTGDGPSADPDPGAARAPQGLLRCLDNTGYAASLEVGTVYQRLADPSGDAHGWVRVIDESGEDYLFEAARFEPVRQGPVGRCVPRPPVPDDASLA